MHGDAVSLAKQPDLLAAAARRVARLLEEDALATLCAAAVASDARASLVAARAACDALATQEGEGPFPGPGSSGQGSSGSSGSQGQALPGLPAYLRAHQTSLAQRLRAVEALQAAWLADAEAAVRALCGINSGGGGDLAAVLAAEQTLTAGAGVGGNRHL